MALTATDLFNDATTREIGGVGPDQVNLIVSDLIGVQQMLQAAVPTINNLSDLHTQIIINQLNEEIASVENANSPTGTLILGTDLGQFVGRAINDIHRDIIDIAQGDAGVQALFNPTALPDLNTPPAPFHDSADQTAFVTQWIQDSNHLGQMAQTIANNGFQGDVAGLIQQIQTFNTNSNAFDQSQGGLFSARFWNEFRTDGTSGTAATALIEGLQTHNAGEVAAAVEQLATNSADVASNNRMADGGTYADVLAAAQATAVTPVIPDPPSTPPGDSAPAFSDLGTTFNDATRALVGGLGLNAVEEGAQGNGSVFRYVNDLTNVQTGLQAEVTAGQFAGDQLTHVQTILSDITTAISAATASVNGGGTFGSVAAAEAALRASHLDILTTVNTDPALQALATQNGATGFQATPKTLADGVTAATAPHENLAEIGAIFDDAASRILGGVNADNKAIITDDINAVVADLGALIQSQPMLFGGLTGIHADTVMRQAQLELAYINQAGINPDAGRASNDNILDMIDIIQGDTNLANMANQGGVAGFSVFPDSLNPTPRYQDNDAQTNFWANFIADGNSLGQQAIQLVGSGDANAINALISQLQLFEKNASNFDLAQGGIFEARFDNELTPSSTLGAEVDAMIRGLTTGNAALVAAAAQVIHDNAADVGGNNIPVTGGTYNPDGLTVADVLSTAGTPLPAAAPVAETPAATPVAAAPAAPPVEAAPVVQAAAAAPASTTAAPETTSTVAEVTAPDIQHHFDDLGSKHDFHHLWG